jgi:hypothetical protein
MKLLSNREPNWDDARESVTIVMEKVTPATLIIEAAMVDRRARASAGPPEYSHSRDWVPASWIARSSTTDAVESTTALATIAIGMNQYVERSCSHR